MPNFRFLIAYDGTRYFGWERQPGKDTIQGKLEAVLSRMVECEAELIGAGRTDAGVHAKGMVANAHLDTAMTAEEIRDYMNRFLPDDICVQEVKEAGERFHARYNAIGKTYTYTCYVGATKPVFNRRYVTVLENAPDVVKMQEASRCLVGEKDYKAFCANPRMKKSTVRRIDSITIERHKDYLYFVFHGNGFLQNMVRILVGTLLQVGNGEIPPERVAEILEGGDRRLAGPTAPPQGLCLTEVDY